MTLIIQNGLIVDGSGKPGFYGDVVIDGDKIVDVVGEPSTFNFQLLTLLTPLAVL